MVRSSSLPRALSLCMLMLGLLVVIPGSAQAETGANWMVNGSNVNSTLLPTLQASEVENASFIVRFKISGALNEFLCTGIQNLGWRPTPSGGSTPFDMHLTGCIDLLNGVLSKPCKPKAGGAAFGTITTNELKSLLVLHEGKGLVRIQPLTGETIATVEFDPEGECSLPEKIPIKGVLYIKDSQGEEQVEKVTHLLSQGPLTHLFVISDTAEHATNLSGTVVFALSGAHSGLKWSGLPG